MTFEIKPMKKCTKSHHRSEELCSITRLPCEVLKDIISRLPIKSIVQSKCVSRSWKLQFNDPHVFQMHISRCPGFKFFFFQQYNGNELSFIEFNNENFDDVNVGTVRKIDSMPLSIKPSIIENNTWRIMILASSNGLLCLQDYDAITDWTCVYSPFTRDYKLVPKLDSKFSPSAYGFGYHRITGEYKIVRIGVYSGEGDKNLEVQSEVHVYTLSKDEWRYIGRVPDEQLGDMHGDGVLFCGRLYWPRARSFSGLMYYDLADDSLGSVPMLAETILKDVQDYELVVLGDCLSVAVTKYHDLTEWIQIWVMKEYGCWVKRYTLLWDAFKNLDPEWEEWERLHVIGLVGSGEIVLEYASRMMVSYHCDTHICKKITFGGSFLPTSWIKISLDDSSR
ncbi:unnamed protein product [Cuscuta europaea]|nr:unnamed protein product [Cuscuta europaea]